MEALVGLVGVVLGILVGKTLERLIDLRRRRDREVDMVFALHAEISAGLGSANEQTAPAEARYLTTNEWPFGPSDRTDFVFESLKNDLSILPQEVIHPTIRYYRLAEQSNLLVDFLQNDGYAKQTPDERKLYAAHILEKLDEQSRAGRSALDALEAFIRLMDLPVPPRGDVHTSGLIGPAIVQSSDAVHSNIGNDRERR